VDRIFATAANEQGFWGVMVRDADSGETVYALNETKHFIPASNAKLFTTAMALATLGPNFRMRTRVFRTGPIVGGRLQGDVVLVGAGDPNLSNRVLPFEKKAERAGQSDKVLAELADAVLVRTVQEITGDVVADDSYFERGRFPPGWTVDDTVWSYGSAVSAISVNDNALTIEVGPGEKEGAPVAVSMDPEGGIYQVSSRATTSARRTEAKLELSREPESRIFYLSGTYPLNATPRLLTVAVPEPAENVAAMLKNLLEKRGVRVHGTSRAWHSAELPPWPAGSEPVLLAEHASAPLIDDVRLTNKLSLNLHAELMLRVAAREAGAATPDEAIKFADDFRKNTGLAEGDVLLTDGSGLSRKGLVTPAAVVQWLAWAENRAWGSEFRASLPIAGEDGTLANRLTTIEGRIRAKSGRIDHVEALSGYATSTRGARLIFSILNNNRPTDSRRATEIVDAICIAMVEELAATNRGPQVATPALTIAAP
jgi:serine-type D-Ala-D-Ala carboxypeptidase/endopeptidase (penicillin-binding protein 4)